MPTPLVIMGALVVPAAGLLTVVSLVDIWLSDAELFGLDWFMDLSPQPTKASIAVPIDTIMQNFHVLISHSFQSRAFYETARCMNGILAGRVPIGKIPDAPDYRSVSRRRVTGGCFFATCFRQNLHFARLKLSPFF